MINWFKDKYGNLKAWVVKNGKKILVTLVSLTVLTAGGLATLPKDEVPYIDVNGEIIVFPYTDDNSGEDLIIRTDREEYSVAGYNEVATAYVAVGNNSGGDDMVDLVSYFPEEVNVKGISRLQKDKVFSREVPTYEEQCKTEEIVATTTKTATTTEVCEQIQTGTKTVTSTRDVWNNINPTSFETLKRIPLNKKAVPGELIRKKTSGTTIKKGYIEVFRVQFTTDQKWGERKEFFFEAVGDKGYGHLDPTIVSGDWSYYFSIKPDIASTTGVLSEPYLLYNGSNAPANCTNNLKSDGTDLRVSTSTPEGDVYVLTQDLRSASTTAGQWELMFKPPTHSSSSQYYVYCGNNSATDISTTTTYNSNITVIYSLDEQTSATTEDITANTNDGSYNGNLPEAFTGIIRAGQNADGSSGWVNTGLNQAMVDDDFYWSMIAHAEKSTRDYISKNTSGQSNIIFGSTNSTDFQPQWWDSGDGPNLQGSVDEIKSNEWNYITAFRSGNTHELWTNCEQSASASDSNTGSNSASIALLNGSDDGSGAFADIGLDEIIIADNSDLGGADFAETTCWNQMEADNYWTVGTATSTVPAEAPTPVRGNVNWW